MPQEVGVLELASKYRYGLTNRGAPLYLFKPYDADKPEYYVGSSERDTSRNQIALVDCPPGEKRGNLVRLIGPVGDTEAEKTALLLHYCPTRHKKTEPTAPETADDAHRTHLDATTGWLTFHIDPPGCRDVDDAIAFHSARRTWAITIADAAAAVPVDSAIDTTAKAIGATFYDLEGRALTPMLPPTISEDAASLLPHETRRGVTLFIDPDGTETFGLTWITVAHSFTYDSFVGSAVQAQVPSSAEPHEWIEALMIRYNRAVAALLKSAGVGILRVQAEAAPASIPIDGAIYKDAATYESVADGAQTHATLGGIYCHASSPLRRYADLANQRILKALLLRSHPTCPLGSPTLPAHLNQRTKAAKRWTRDLTFLTHVTPGRVHIIDVIWLTAPSDEKIKVWVPAWKRAVRLRHEERHDVGYAGRIEIFCDPRKRNWKQRVLTSQIHAPV